MKCGLMWNLIRVYTVFQTKNVRIFENQIYDPRYIQWTILLSLYQSISIQRVNSYSFCLSMGNELIGTNSLLKGIKQNCKLQK